MKITEELLKKFPEGDPPFQVNVKKALNYYIGPQNLYYVRFPAGASGGLVKAKEKLVVFINLNQSKRRIHWTEAHELAEFFLHYETTYESFYFSLHYEDRQKEKRANAFAAEILLPENIIREITSDFLKLDIVSLKDAFIKEAANKFFVSELAFRNRLKYLKIKF
jgi:Zn-dependent peptidase ImmA (M78 family)